VTCILSCNTIPSDCSVFRKFISFQAHVEHIRTRFRVASSNLASITNNQISWKPVWNI